MKKIIFATLLFLSTGLFLFGQTKSERIKLVCDALMKSKTGSVQENCVKDKENGMTLSCFQIDSKPEWVADFNGDGVDDVLAYVMDEGLGGGGNAFGFDYNAVLIKNGKIDSIISIFGGGKFSYANLEIDKVEDKKIYATYAENPLSRSDFADSSPLREVNLVFEYKNGLMMEQSYNRCPIAEMDKRIFKSTSTYTIKRTTDINTLFEVEQTERLYLDKNEKNHIYASLGGCQNIDLYFRYDIPYDKTLVAEKAKAKEKITSFLQILQDNCRFASTIKLLNEKLKPISLKKEQEYEVANMDFKLNNGWDAFIIMSEYSDNQGKGISIITRFSKNSSDTPTEFWDKIKR